MSGYEAYSFKFGSNNLFHTDLTDHKWNDAQKNDFPLVPTPIYAMQWQPFVNMCGWDDEKPPEWKHSGGLCLHATNQ